MGESISKASSILTKVLDIKAYKMVTCIILVTNLHSTGARNNIMPMHGMGGVPIVPLLCVSWVSILYYAGKVLVQESVLRQKTWVLINVIMELLGWVKEYNCFIEA